MDNFISLLDECLLSENVTTAFHGLYENNTLFKQQLLTVLPEIELCKAQEQNCPWHIYNVLDHILHSVEKMNEQTKNMPHKKRRLLAYVMFLHDIGKPFKWTQRMENGVQVDSFPEHNIASEDIAKRVCTKLGFCGIESKLLCLLVKEHDMFMFLKDFEIPPKQQAKWQRLTPQLVKDKIDSFDKIFDGKKVMEYLLMVGYADKGAQNPQKTGYDLHIINKIGEMLRHCEEK